MQKRGFNIVDIAVAIEMVLIDVEDQGDFGLELEERPVEFACLAQEIFPAAQPRGAADGV